MYDGIYFSPIFLIFFYFAAFKKENYPTTTYYLSFFFRHMYLFLSSFTNKYNTLSSLSCTNGTTPGPRSTSSYPLGLFILLKGLYTLYNLQKRHRLRHAHEPVRAVPPALVLLQQLHVTEDSAEQSGENSV